MNTIKTVSFILVVADIPSASAFYQKAFQMNTDYLIKDETGRIISCCLKNDNFNIILSLEDPNHSTCSPSSIQKSSTTMVIETIDVDKVALLFTEAGGKKLSGPKERYWGARAVLLECPEGHRWMFQQTKNFPSVEKINEHIHPWKYQKP
jgi:PhnB protein